MRTRGMMLVAAVLTAGTSLSGCTDSTDGATASRASDLSVDYAQCRDRSDDSVGFTTAFTLGDQGHTLIGNGVKGDQIVDLACMLSKLGTSQAVVAEMDSTTAMMGRQSEDYNGYKYEWSYHPDNGFDLIVTEG